MVFCQKRCAKRCTAGHSYCVMQTSWRIAATVVLSVIMLAKGMMGLKPELDVVAMLAAMMNSSAMMGWIAHFMISTVLGGVYKKLT